MSIRRPLFSPALTAVFSTFGSLVVAALAACPQILWLPVAAAEDPVVRPAAVEPAVDPTVVDPAVVPVVELRAPSRTMAHHLVDAIDADADCFAMAMNIDPVAAAGGDMQVVAEFAVGVQPGFAPESGSGPDRKHAAISVGLREGSGRAAWLMWHQGSDLIQTDPEPKPPGYDVSPDYQHANVRLIADDDGYDVRLVVWPAVVTLVRRITLAAPVA